MSIWSRLKNEQDYRAYVEAASWSMRVLYFGEDKLGVDPQKQLEKLSVEALEWVCENCMGFPIGEIARLELLKRRNLILDWKFQRVEKGSLSASVKLNQPLNFIRMSFIVEDKKE